MSDDPNEQPNHHRGESLSPTQSYQPKQAEDDTSLNEFNSTTDVEYSGDPASGKTNEPDNGDFEFIEELGRGGMGVVNKCRQKSLDRVVAVKSILSSSFPDEKQLSRFLDEARAVAKLKHENIVSIHQVSHSTSNPFFVMEFVEGKPLDQLIRTWTLDQNRAVRIMIQIGKAIQAAHHQRIVHRDLKPANVLIDANDQVRVTDFGLAKFLGAETSKTIDGQILGTPSFMAPEQAKGKSSLVDERTDIYAIGATLYACLTGSAPFRADGISEILSLVQEAEPIPPCKVNPKISRDLETICLKCLEKDPANRYQTAEELNAEFNRFLSDEPIKARPVSSVNRLVRRMRKKPLQSSLLGSTVVLLLLIAIVVPSLYISNQNLRVRNAEQERLSGLKNELTLGLSNGLWKESLSIADQLLEYKPNDRTLVFSKLRSWNALGNRQLVVDEIERVDSQVPELADDAQFLLWKGDSLLLSDDEENGIGLIKRALETNQLEAADQCYAQALMSENTQEVIALLRQAITHEPAHHRATTFLFSSLLVAGKLDLAEAHVDQSLAKFPKDPNLWAMKLITQAALGKTDKIDGIKTRAIELGEEPLRRVLDDMLKEYSAWASIMDRWESADYKKEFGSIVDYVRKLGDIQQQNPTAPNGWQFDKSFLRLPRGWKKNQGKIQASLSLVFLHQYQSAAEGMVETIDENTNGETLFMIGQAYMLAEEYILAAKYFDMACSRPSRFKNVAREANWVAAMCYATLWLKDKENRKLINESNKFARRHLEHPPVHVWHEITLGKIACNDMDFVTAKRYLDRLKKFAPGDEAVPAYQQRVYAIASAPVEDRIQQLAKNRDKDNEELLKEIDAYQAEMIEKIRKNFESAKASLEN